MISLDQERHKGGNQRRTTRDEARLSVFCAVVPLTCSTTAKIKIELNLYTNKKNDIFVSFPLWMLYLCVFETHGKEQSDYRVFEVCWTTS